MLTIKDRTFKTAVIQTPLAGCTDLAFRLIARDHGMELAFTEMISSEALVRAHKKTYTLLKRAREDSPTGCQIVGPDPDSMGRSAAILEPLGFDILDINCGCPVRKITGQEAGAALLKDPKRAGKIFRSVIRSVKAVPVTVKMRTGYTDPSGKEAVRLARIAEDCGLSAVTVHGRTKAQGYSGKADWRIIESVKKVVTIPVIGNGDVFSAADALRMRSETGCDGIAIGRGSLGNPWIFGQIRAAFGHNKRSVPSFREVKQTALRHMDLTALWDGEKTAHLKSRHIACWYFKGCPGSSRLRERINRSRSFEDIVSIVKAYEPHRPV
ncbi:MAG: tRNA-dihydrouridine synthase C [Candidatus Omnitrophica bacterium ADurb.Bin314]|nr:MAG: tRNA-dihydrouridine synthase C [Candidatus Omnitrophica bacterium ADurb.Bin314]HOE69051.1 tRNA dihydrouridine synthase DusB [Candidatus Omnitrophota bacterium]HPW64598.1 tRNA dihydrouridine synthase DusB [Candidatus Omnitrophota bacterium]